MATIDLTHVTELSIKMMENKAGGFELKLDPGGPVLTGATAIMVISKGAFIQTLSLGNGITITGVDRFALSLPALEEGMYKYNLEITPISGEAMRFMDTIHVISG